MQNQEIHKPMNGAMLERHVIEERIVPRQSLNYRYGKVKDQNKSHYILMPTKVAVIKNINWILKQFFIEKLISSSLRHPGCMSKLLEGRNY